MARKIRSVSLVGRRWFNKAKGNTYHSVDIYVNGEHVHKVDYAYGYGDQWLYTASDWLTRNGVIELENRLPGRPPEPLWQWAKRKGVEFVYSVTDVSRKKDL